MKVVNAPVKDVPGGGANFKSDRDLRSLDPEDRDFAVYSFFDSATQSYFYTKDEDEKEYIQNTIGDNSFEDTGIAYISADRSDPLTGQAAEGVYRFEDLDTGARFYTIIEEEKEYIDEYLTEDFEYEEIAFYAFEPSIGETIPGTIPVYRYFNVSSEVHSFIPEEELETFLQIPGNEDYVLEGVAFHAFAFENSTGNTILPV